MRALRRRGVRVWVWVWVRVWVRVRIRVRVRWLRPNPLMHTSFRVIGLNGVRSDDLPCECPEVPRRSVDPPTGKHKLG